MTLKYGGSWFAIYRSTEGRQSILQFGPGKGLVLIRMLWCQKKGKQVGHTLVLNISGLKWPELLIHILLVRKVSASEIMIFGECMTTNFLNQHKSITATLVLEPQTSAAVSTPHQGNFSLQQTQALQKSTGNPCAELCSPAPGHIHSSLIPRPGEHGKRERAGRL